MTAVGGRRCAEEEQHNTSTSLWVLHAFPLVVSSEIEGCADGIEGMTDVGGEPGCSNPG